MRRKEPSLMRYNIDRNIIGELKHLCLQYPKLKHQVASVTDIPAVNIAGMPHATGVSTPTENRALILCVQGQDVKQIEDAAKQAGQDVWMQLLRFVTEEIRFEELTVPCGRRQFYSRRRYFFYILAKKRGKI